MVISVLLLVVGQLNRLGRCYPCRAVAAILLAALTVLAVWTTPFYSRLVKWLITGAMVAFAGAMSWLYLVFLPG